LTKRVPALHGQKKPEQIFECLIARHRILIVEVMGSAADQDELG
jgi:hypothetical protein